tara:strand:- start:297 stop:569 length:273 start_codon:yes stop_codon:yes gene_type:complete
MAFTFPDPSVISVVINPETGVTYKYANGIWSPISDDAEQLDFEELEKDVEDLQDLDVATAISLLQIARQDIMELKSKVSTLELTNFLILE